MLSQGCLWVFSCLCISPRTRTLPHPGTLCSSSLFHQRVMIRQMSACLQGRLPFDTGQTEREMGGITIPLTASSLVYTGVNPGLRGHAEVETLPFISRSLSKTVIRWSGDTRLQKLALTAHSFVWMDCCVYSVQGPLFLLIWEKILWHHLCKFHLFLVLCSGSSSGNVGFMGSFNGSCSPLDSPSSSLVSTPYTFISCFLSPL